MSTFFLSYIGNPDLATKHIDGFFFVVNELNRDEIRLYNNFMVYKAWAKILSLKRTLYLNEPTVIKCLFKNLADLYVQGNKKKFFNYKDLNFVKFHTTVSKNLVVNKKRLPLITFGNIAPYFTKPFYMAMLLKNKACSKFLIKLCELPMELLENVPETNSKFLFLLTDCITVLLVLVQ